MDLKPLLRAYNPALYDLIQPYRVTDDAFMPLAYRDIPGGRPLHDDWGVMGKLPALQPWQRIRRMDCAYRIPLPAKIIKGPYHWEWQLWDATYPLAPGFVVEDRPIWDGTRSVMAPHVFLQVSELGRTEYAGFIAGEWRPCFTRYSGRVMGRTLKYYNGLKPDVGCSFDESLNIKSDCLWWFPEISVSWTKP